MIQLTNLLQGLGLKVVVNVEEAEFILAHGTEALGHPSGAAFPVKVEELENIMERCAARNIPMVVANPDFVTVEARDLRLMPGRNLVWYFDFLIIEHIKLGEKEVDTHTRCDLCFG